MAKAVGFLLEDGPSDSLEQVVGTHPGGDRGYQTLIQTHAVACGLAGCQPMEVARQPQGNPSRITLIYRRGRNFLPILENGFDPGFRNVFQIPERFIRRFTFGEASGKLQYFGGKATFFRGRYDSSVRKSQICLRAFRVRTICFGD